MFSRLRVLVLLLAISAVFIRFNRIPGAVIDHGSNEQSACDRRGRFLRRCGHNHIELQRHATYAASSGSANLTVNPATQTITFPNSGAQTYGVAPITSTATATSSLPASYADNSGPASVSGSTLTISGVGSGTIQATQSGNINYRAAIPVSDTFTVSQGTTEPDALLFVPMTPCRLADTRNAAGPFGGPSIAGKTSRSFVVPNSTCAVPSTAAAYSINVTVVPKADWGI